MKRKSVVKKIISAIVLLLVITIVIIYLITHMLMKQNFDRGSYSEYSVNYRYADYEADYPRRAVSFLSGKNTLYGYVYGEGNDKGLVVFSHGIGGGHENYINDVIWFVNQGYCVFAFDNTGSCESEGKGTMGLSQSALDLDAALCYIETDNALSVMKKLLYGHSWGGYAVTAVLNFEHDITASASVAGYAEPLEMITEFAENIMSKEMVWIAYPFICFDNWLTFGKYATLSAVDGINKSNIPVLVIHGTADETIGYERSAIIAKKDKITNPNVQYYTVAKEGMNGHNSIFRSVSANAYRDMLNTEYQELSASYNENIPADVKRAFYDNADKAKANEQNQEMLEEINRFFEAALAAGK